MEELFCKILIITCLIQYSCGSYIVHKHQYAGGCGCYFPFKDCYHHEQDKGNKVDPDNEAQAREWLDTYNANAQAEWEKYADGYFSYGTNITAENIEKFIGIAASFARWQKQMDEYASQYNWEEFEDEDTRTQFSLIANSTQNTPPEKDRNRTVFLELEMTRIFSTFTLCGRPNDKNTDKCYPLEPDLHEIMATSDNWHELLWAWDGWRRLIGSKITDKFEELVELLNAAAVLGGAEDAGASWRGFYNNTGFENVIAKLWEDVKPLYEQLHTYVRRKLMTKYSDFASHFPSTRHIPAHLVGSIGDLWRQSWRPLEALVRPYPDKPGINLNYEMTKQGYTAERIFRLSEDFYTSMGLLPMPENFWKETMFEKPDDREVDCYPTAHPFIFRITQCTQVNTTWIDITLHEMGHIQYDLQYNDLPVVFRDGANPGFHEAIGDVLSLSVYTPSHLKRIGLFPEYEPDPKTHLNYLMYQALDTVAFMPFGYIVDLWRWGIFNGSTTREKYNEKWWDLVCEIQGLSPPTKRPKDWIDTGFLLHVPANVPHIRYFVAYILKFQFYKALCDAAGYEGPLYLCDFYDSKEAGKRFSDMLSLGSTVEWPEALESIVGSREMSAAPFLEYFQPLMDWLVEVNEGEDIGWKPDCPSEFLP